MREMCINCELSRSVYLGEKDTDFCELCYPDYRREITEENLIIAVKYLKKLFAAHSGKWES